MTLTYSLVRAELGKVPAAALARAFRAVRRLTAFDAAHVAASAFAVLLEGLTLAEAQALQTALAAEDLEVLLVPTAELALPEATRICAASVASGQVTLWEEAGRQHTIEIQALRAVGAALVERFEVEALRHLAASRRWVYLGGNVSIHLPVHRWVPDGAVARARMVLDLVTQTRVYRAKEDRFAFPPDMARPAAAKFSPFMAFAAALAPGLRRGVLAAGITMALELGDAVPIYSSLHAYEEELRWRLLMGRTGKVPALPRA